MRGGPMKRRLLNFLTSLSVLLCLTAAALWGRSYWVGYWGRLLRMPEAEAEDLRDPTGARGSFDHAGFLFGRLTTLPPPRRLDSWWVVVPYYAIVLPVAVAPISLLYWQARR